MSVSEPAAAAWPAPQATPIEALSEVRFWPNDPNYAYGDFNSTKPGQWWLYSFVPERAPSALFLRQPGLAAGLSVDAAWRYGVGHSSVILAILDDGIDLLEPDLLSSIVLNLGELAHTPPLVANKPCAPIAPADPNSPRFDCALPPDGEVTLEDFREFLGFGVDGTTDPFRYDANHNGLLDPYDLFQRYQNQRDDDNNGFVDDIVGWNFAESNPLPNHVITRHGTESALDAVAAADNGRGRAGVCSGCRVLPLRVADQRGADPQRLALAILYAAARGARAALIGHLPMGRSETLERAIRSATQRGMLVLMPQDGERQTHSPLHLDLDSWLPIGGLTTSNDSNVTTLTTSFAAPDPCQAFSPGLNYVAAGPVCSRTAPAIALGIAGLVASTERARGGATKLSAVELAATLRATADSIDTTLTSPSGRSSPKQPGIRRLNANTAVEEVRAGVLPPELEIERPYWYEPISLSRLKAPTSVVGRLAATRADSLALNVRVAYGNSPSDTEFQSIPSNSSIDATSPLPSGSVLATIDWRQDIQPPSAEEPEVGAGRIVTLRFQATAHYEALGRAASTWVERKVVILEDADLVAGTPLRIGSTPTSPKIGDVDGDAVDDIVLGTMDGRLLVLSAKYGRIVDATSKPLATDTADAFAPLLRAVPTPTVLTSVPEFLSSPARSSVGAPPAIADLDSDGHVEIIATTLDGRIYALRLDGTSPFAPRSFIDLPGLDERCKGKAACDQASARVERGISSSPVVADVNGDGQLDIVVAAHDGQVHAFGPDGKSLLGWPILVGGGEKTLPGRLVQSPAVADVDGDAVDDLLVTAGEERLADFDRGSHVLVLGGKADRLPRVADGWPVTVESYDAQADRIDRSTPGASIDASLEPVRALLYGNSSQPFFLPASPGLTYDSDTSHTGLPSEATPVSRLDGLLGFDLSSKGPQSALGSFGSFAPLLARPSLGDLDRDGTTDLVVPGASLGSLYALRNNSNSEHQGMLGLFSGETGRMLPAAPIALGDFVSTSSAAIADITNDGIPEVIVANGATGVLAVDACGRTAPGWPKVTGSRVKTSPAVGDIDGDGFLEVVVTTEDGWLYVWRTRGSAHNYVPWASDMNDRFNRSSLQPPSNTTTPKHPPRIRLNGLGECDMSDAPPVDPPAAPQLSARGGCTCASAPRPARSAEWIAGIALLLSMRRRRTAQ